MNPDPLNRLTEVAGTTAAYNQDHHDKLRINQRQKKKDKKERRHPEEGAVEDLIDHSHDEDADLDTPLVLASDPDNPEDETQDKPNLDILL